MHGLGDTADGFSDVASMWSRQLPHVKFVLPTAPTQPVTLNMGMPMPSWYDIKGLSERTNEECDGIGASNARILKILQDEHSSTGLPYERMVLSGFSQGGAMSIFTGLQMPPDKKLAGVLVMSGYLAGAGQFTLSAAGAATKTLHCHGTADPMVNYGMATKTRDLLLEGGHGEYELRPYEGLVHSVSVEELQDGLEFLKGVLPDDPECKVKEKEVEEMSVKELKAAIRKGGLGKEAVGMTEKRELVELLKNNKK